MYSLTSSIMAGLVVWLTTTVPVVFAQQSAWGQCGGTGWTGETTCVSGDTCTSSSEYYSQCVPGTAVFTSTTLQTSTITGTGTSTATATGTGTASTTTVPSVSTTVASAGYPGTTLQSGYYWIRAVESPNFHSYLQTTPTAVPGTALMDSYLTAGQFNIVDGQLVELVSSSGGLLYANVEQQANSSVTKLGVTFETTQNTFGTFAFSGDAVQWSVSTIDRPNLSAWLVCTSQLLFINLGAYDYDTPAGCADETIHYYNGATAND